MDLTIYIISDKDGIGMTKLARDTMDKFEIEYKEKSYLNINNQKDLDNVVTDLKKDFANKIIFNSLIDPDHDKYLKDSCKDLDILNINYSSYSIKKISNYLGIKPINIKLDDEIKAVHHFKRLDAIDFAIQYDDGQDFKGLKYCDICIIGVSRSSKTPLSVYLASIGYKVSNVPILLESQIPQELFEIDSNKIFGLTIDKNRLQKIRQERLKSIKLPEESKYSDLSRIEKELDYALEIMNDLDCTIIDVTDKSIEETSEYIISVIENI